MLLKSCKFQFSVCKLLLLATLSAYWSVSHSSSSAGAATRILGASKTVYATDHSRSVEQRMRPAASDRVKSSAIDHEERLFPDWIRPALNLLERLETVYFYVKAKLLNLVNWRVAQQPEYHGYAVLNYVPSNTDIPPSNAHANYPTSQSYPADHVHDDIPVHVSTASSNPNINLPQLYTLHDGDNELKSMVKSYTFLKKFFLSEEFAEWIEKLRASKYSEAEIATVLCRYVENPAAVINNIENTAKSEGTAFPNYLKRIQRAIPPYHAHIYNTAHFKYYFTNKLTTYTLEKGRRDLKTMLQVKAPYPENIFLRSEFAEWFTTLENAMVSDVDIAKEICRAVEDPKKLIDEIAQSPGYKESADLRILNRIERSIQDDFQKLYTEAHKETELKYLYSDFGVSYTLQRGKLDLAKLLYDNHDADLYVFQSPNFVKWYDRLRNLGTSDADIAKVLYEVLNDPKYVLEAIDKNTFYNFDYKPMLKDIKEFFLKELPRLTSSPGTPTYRFLDKTAAYTMEAGNTDLVNMLNAEPGSEFDLLLSLDFFKWYRRLRNDGFTNDDIAMELWRVLKNPDERIYRLAGMIDDELVANAGILKFLRRAIPDNQAYVNADAH